MIKDGFLIDLIGTTKSQATESIKSLDGVSFIVVRNDDESYMSDMMYDEARIRLEIEKGLVVKVSVG